METTVIRTKAMITKPEYILNGHVVLCDKTKFYPNHQITACYIRHSSSDTSFLIRSYDGVLTFTNGSSIAVKNTYVIGEHTVYEYERPKVASETIINAHFLITENVTRIDFINVEYIGFFGRANVSQPYNADYISYNTKQLLYRPIFSDYIPYFALNYQDIDLDLGLLSQYRVKELQCSGNWKVYGDIQSLVNSAEVITTINAAWGKSVTGDLAVVLNAIKDAGRTSFNLGTSLARTAVTVNGQTIKSAGNIVFDANGDWDASAIL